ncbi:hypothetical protein EYB53_014450 [Candidatus Chloroploca sp. M-50]|uniref:Methionine synthase n=1 Tax=Candidatus Chloroploca mongolica TaxID=2528176 RepID=A0ABS4DBU6_9CHLR|nr:hypothetical protein [Candidatus Chloroploca mongolica]MBP1466912.1 hypothetical protein [Candidatus Chloroploca mongolica]
MVMQASTTTSPVSTEPGFRADTPGCLPVPRVGVPVHASVTVQGRLAALAQRNRPEQPFALAMAGFPGGTLELKQARAVIDHQAAEATLARLALAYLNHEETGAVPPPEQTRAIAEALRQFEQIGVTCARLELTGPVSLALQVVDDHERPLAYDLPLREALCQHTILRANWYFNQLKGVPGLPMVCFDEPFLDALSSPLCPLDWEAGTDMLMRTLGELPPTRALCVAGVPNWAAVLALPAEVVFFDAYEHSAGLIQAASAVAGYLDRGGMLGWGIVPHDEHALGHENAATLVQRFESTVAYLSAAGGINANKIYASAFISTSGRLCHLPSDRAAYAAQLCAEVASKLRSVHCLEATTST